MSCVETRVKSINASSISNKICRSWSWVFNYDHHHNGRIWVGWDPNVWIVNVISKTSQHVTCSVTFLEKQVHFFVSFVYALNKPYQREPLWSYLISQGHTITSPQCILGDFNCVVSLDEISGGWEHWTPDMQCFKECLSDAGLGHLNSVGALFTWTNK